MTPQDIVDKLNSPQQTPFEVYYTINDFLDKNMDDEALLYIQDRFKCDKDIVAEALAIYKENVYKEHKQIEARAMANLTPQQIAHANAVAKESLNKPKCPICGSTNLSKITGAQKAMKIAAFGVFGMGDNGKTWKCNNCGSKF